MERASPAPLLVLLALAAAPAQALSPAGPASRPADPAVLAARVESDADAIASVTLDCHHAYSSFQHMRARWTDRTDDDVCLAIRRIVDRYAGSTNLLENISRANAVAFLAELASTNAYALAESLARTEPPDRGPGPDGSIVPSAFYAAVIALPPLAFREPANLPSFAAFLDGPDSRRHGLRDLAYRQTDALLRRDPPPRTRLRALRFLADRAAVETELPALVDGTLCRELPGWRNGPQRAANAERLLGTLPTNAPARAFFEGVLSQTPGVARSAIPLLDPHDPCAPLFRDLTE